MKISMARLTKFSLLGHAADLPSHQTPVVWDLPTTLVVRQQVDSVCSGILEPAVVSLQPLVLVGCEHVHAVGNENDSSGHQPGSELKVRKLPAGECWFVGNKSKSDLRFIEVSPITDRPVTFLRRSENKIFSDSLALMCINTSGGLHIHKKFLTRIPSPMYCLWSL
ncbi:hypothetical protein AYI69_g8025 [Smittium culicis]|uniref:Uncharacterized protein n=1 Tax=Smittium culicis TaxID=133412 RepID=A0A1R1XMS1_9FUNG|nr:hypothetical protein AYI69_g8025 [Smittium culicis]